MLGINEHGAGEGTQSRCLMVGRERKDGPLDEKGVQTQKVALCRVLGTAAAIAQ